MTKTMKPVAVLIGLDRGGLCRVSENTYMVFNHMEMLVRKVFNVTAVQEVTSELRERVKRSAMADEDIHFYWCMLTTDVDEEVGTILLSMIVDVYITIRGFSFAKSFVEQYKHVRNQHRSPKL